MNSARRTLFYIRYSMGNFANTIAYQVFGNRIQFYYVDILGLNAAVGASSGRFTASGMPSTTR
jgi:hypothetical protein